MPLTDEVVPDRRSGRDRFVRYRRRWLGSLTDEVLTHGRSGSRRLLRDRVTGKDEQRGKPDQEGGLHDARIVQ
jgi:hypothetical protein